MIPIPSAILWMSISHWMAYNFIPRHHHRHRFDIKLRGAAHSARYDAWKQQAEGLMGMRS